MFINFSPNFARCFFFFKFSSWRRRVQSLNVASNNLTAQNMRSSHASHHHHRHQTSFTLPQIKISDFDGLLKPAGKRVSDDWETGVKALGNIAGYRYSAGMRLSLFSHSLSLAIPFTAQRQTLRTCLPSNNTALLTATITTTTSN